MRHVIVLRPGKDIHVNSKHAQVAGEFCNVDVHPAGILAAKGGKRAGMVAEHGDIHEDSLPNLKGC